MTIIAAGLGAALIASLLLALRLKAQLAHTTETGRAVIDSLDFGVIATTPDPEIMICNRMVAETLGLTSPGNNHLYRVDSDSLLEAICADFAHPADDPAKSARKPFDIIDRNGRYRRWERTLLPLDGTVQVALLRDRTEVQELTLQLEKSTGMDALTGLATRDIFLDRLTQALEIGQRNGSLTGILVIEIDGFAQLVDQQGWAQARQIVADVAMRIASTTRASDTIARIGHSEFAVLLTNLPGAATAQHTARRFLEAVRIPALSAGNESFPPIPISGSIGIALSPRDASTALHLLRNASAACQRAIRMGGGQMTAYEAALDEERSPAASFATEIRRGLEDGQFHLEYQPIVDLAARHPLWLEALLRWHHPMRGEMPVDAFITAAGQSGLIHDLGDFVLRTAARDALRPATSLPVSVNVSVMELMACEWPQHVEALLGSAGVAADRMMVEISDSASITNLARLASPVAELRARGVRVLLDDFGTGRTSLSDLDAIGFDGLKIDRQLVYELDDSRSRERIQLLLDYCAARDVTAIAVGIETEEQAARLLDMGCLCGQGYLFGRPAPWSPAGGSTRAAGAGVSRAEAR